MNPYLLAARRQERARASAAGPSGWALALAPVAAAWVAGRLVPPAFFDPGRDVGAGLADIYARVSILLAAGVSLHAYQAVVRGADRGVVDLHPVLPGPWFVGRLWAVARGTAPWLGAAVAFVGPLAIEPTWFLQGALSLFLGWLAAVAVGVSVNVAAPAVGLDPRWAAVLDAARGPNPRLQAALLYAPGVALVLSGGAALAGAWGVTRAVAGEPAGLLVAVPLLVAAGLVRFGRAHAGEVSRFPAVLGEIEAAWAGAETEEEARHVYLDWAVRLVPPARRADLLRELRHLWRSQRGWVLGAWALAGLAALDAWSGGARAGVVGVAITGVAGARLAAEEPAWLEAWLGLGWGRVVLGRALATWLHLQVVVLGAAVGLLGGHALPMLRAELAAVGLAGVAGVVGVGMRGRAVAAYLPAALVIGGVLG